VLAILERPYIITRIMYTADEELLTAKEVIPLLKISASQLYALVHQGAIPAIRIGSKSVRFRKTDIDILLTLGTSLPKAQAVKIGGAA
jgi:excisionase family DNA binding protein